MLPILISVSVAPVSYFFWARAAVAEAASKTRTAGIAADRRCNARISNLPGLLNVSCFFAWRRFGLNGHSIPLRGWRQQKALCDAVTKGSFFRREARNKAGDRG